MPSHNDYIQKFYFPNAGVRGAIVKLSNSFIEALNGHDYPETINRLLGESLAAATLLSSHLKFSSRFTFQAQGHGPISLLLAESILNKSTVDNTPHQHTVRAYARMNDNKTSFAHSAGLPDILGKANLVMSVEPLNKTASKPTNRYQSIIEASSASLAENLSDYFEQSEQLSTRLQLAVNETIATGILLQQMPTYGGENQPQIATSANAWDELAILIETLTNQELFGLPAADILHRLFNEHDYHIYSAENVQFNCQCSQQRSEKALLSVAKQELQEMLDQDGEIVIDCEFCSAKYRFSRKAMNTLWAKEQKDPLPAKH